MRKCTSATLSPFFFLILNPVTKMMSFQHICMLRMIYRVATNDR